MILNDNKHRTSLVKRCKYVTQQMPALEHLYTITTELSHASPNRARIIITNYDCTQETTWLIFEQFLNEVKRKSGWMHGLVFLDPPSPRNMPLKFLLKILSIPSDVITLLHTGMFAENVSMRRYKPNTLVNILDCDIRTAESLLEQTHTIDELEDLYLRKFYSLLKNTKMNVSGGSSTRDVIKSIKLRTARGHYHLIVATRVTRGQQFMNWQKWLNDFADEVSKLSDVNPLVLSILSGRQTTLDSQQTVAT